MREKQRPSTEVAKPKLVSNVYTCKKHVYMALNMCHSHKVAAAKLGLAFRLLMEFQLQVPFLANFP